MDILIETERLILRPFNRDDAASACYNSRQPVIARFMSDMVLNSEEDALGWIDWINNKKTDINIPCIILAVELKQNKKCAGLIGVAPKRELNNEIEILFGIADEYQNKGYITEATDAFIKWVFKNTSAEYLIAIVKHENYASKRVIEKSGFIYRGEKRIIYDGEMTDFYYYRLYKPVFDIISVREHPEFYEKAVDYFSSIWGIDRKLYEESISDCISTAETLPRWYLLLKNGEISGCYGLIENDFMVRKDLFPWLCALYINESERGSALGSKLLAHGIYEAGKLGFNKVYLCTDHTGYYEKYGWNFFGQEDSEWGGKTRVYVKNIIK